MVFQFCRQPIDTQPDLLFVQKDFQGSCRSLFFQSFTEQNGLARPQANNVKSKSKNVESRLAAQKLQRIRLFDRRFGGINYFQRDKRIG